jgi:signal transduction histidine kinase
MDDERTGTGEGGGMPSRQTTRALVLVGFAIWAGGLALWEWSWPWSLTTSVAGGLLLTIGLGYLARGARSPGPPVWAVSVPVTLSLILISQGVGQAEFIARVALVGFGSLGLLVVFLHILAERTALERQLAARLLADEQRRLAGEVHDVVGHTLSASMLQLSAARLAIRDDPDAAIASLERAEEHGRRSMEDIGSVVRLLRADEAATGPPSPHLDDLPALIDGFRAAGADISETGSDVLGHLPVTAALTVYRVVQEGLTNAARHGTGTIHLDLARDRDAVRVTMDNDVSDRPAPASSGSGLVVMRERVHAVGGNLTVGPTPDGDRWRLQARIPT